MGLMIAKAFCLFIMIWFWMAIMVNSVRGAAVPFWVIASASAATVLFVYLQGWLS